MHAQITSPIKQDYVEFIRGLHLPRYAELPPIELYMDQLLSYIEEHLRPLMPAGEKLLTSSMVNNYVKQRVMPAPAKKRYGKEHLAHLIAICLMKRTFSLSDIQRLLSAQDATHSTERAYDFFCTTLEESLRAMFCGELRATTLSHWAVEQPNGFAFALTVVDAKTLTPERRLAISAATSAANKIYVEKCFELGLLDEGDDVGAHKHEADDSEAAAEKQ